MTLEPTVVEWVLLAIAAVFVGISKTALPGASTVSIAVFAAIIPARESTAALLMLLLVGDAFALYIYRRHADWRTLLRLAPAVLVGVVMGVAFLAVANNDWVRRVIGVILLVLIAVTLWRRRTPQPESSGRVAPVVYGVTGGFTTMVANAGGPVMSMYFIAMKFPINAFLGTAAWFFAIVNLAKVPFAITLGLLPPEVLAMDLFLIPGVVVGAFIGRFVATRLKQKAFEYVVIALTVAGALYLLI